MNARRVYIKGVRQGMALVFYIGIIQLFKNILHPFCKEELFISWTYPWRVHGAPCAWGLQRLVHWESAIPLGKHAWRIHLHCTILQSVFAGTWKLLSVIWWEWTCALHSYRQSHEESSTTKFPAHRPKYFICPYVHDNYCWPNVLGNCAPKTVS